MQYNRFTERETFGGREIIGAVAKLQPIISLLLLTQKQVYSLPDCLAFCNPVPLAVISQFSFCFLIKPHAIPNILWLFCFWSSCSWAHNLTSLFATPLL